ncbi:hypothetical protein GCM10023081_18490 [Arthrobacter ginkgonis]|uniref:Uncharacterized protein n=1 Tax=Arthrobacter ginkgonis TaxID=1630594 RepID=A0ABP7C948_9MICC
MESRSALNALLVLATMRAIADSVARKTGEGIRRSGEIDTPIGRLSSFNPE